VLYALPPGPHARRECGGRGGAERRRLYLPGHHVEIVGGQLLPVDIQPAYGGHRDLLKLQRGISTPRECLSGQS
jgi:hypothetical protein